MSNSISSNGSVSTNKLEDELFLLLAKQGKIVPLPVFLCAVLVASFVVDELSFAVWGTWLIVVASILSARWYVLGRLPTMTGYSIEVRLRIAITLSAINGITMGASFYFFPYLTEFERAIHSLILVGLSAGSIATTAGYRPLFLAYFIPTLPPLAIMWAVSPGIETGWREYLVAFLITLFSFVMISLARDSFKLFEDSFNIRLQQVLLNNKLQHALLQAESANRAKTRFLASASHDLRQPIHTLSLYGAALKMRKLDERSKDITMHMNTALQVLANQLDALLDISKLDAGVVEINLETINLCIFLKRLYQDYLATANKKGIVLEFECKQYVYIKTDEILFERIIRNLLTNAIKYTDSGHIKLAAHFEKGLCKLYISDTGQGIPHEEQTKIFEEFYQLENPHRDRSKGLGLGLAIVKRLADILDINLEIESVPDQGTTFVLSMEEANSVDESIEESLSKNLSFSHLHVLVIDDEYAVRDGMKILLEEVGCDVLLADSAEQAVYVVKNKQPDIVLSDFHLGAEGNGLDAISAIRAIYPEIPAILISGDTSPDRLIEASDESIMLLHKPVQVDTLKETIAEACTSGSS